MTFQLINRDHNYWNGLHKEQAVLVSKLNKEFESRIKWEQEEPLLSYKTSFSKGPCLVRSGLSCQIVMSDKYMAWLDEVAAEIMSKEGIRESFCLSNSGKDFSPWIMHNWLSWVVSHELGHFYCGHYTPRSGRWEGWQPSDFSGMDKKTRLAIEYDADFFAASWFFGVYAEPNTMAKIKAFENKYFEDLGFLFFCMFFIMELDYPNQSIHPSALDRFYLFLGRGFKVLQTKREDDISGLYSSFLNGANGAALTIDDGHQEDGAGDFMRNLKNIRIQHLTDSALLLIKEKYYIRRLYKMDSDWLLNLKDFLYIPKKNSEKI